MSPDNSIDAASRILIEQNVRRIYSTEFSRGKVAWINEVVSKFHIDAAMKQQLQALARQVDVSLGPDAASQGFETSHVIVPGPADTSPLESLLGTKLPECLSRFYRQISECILTLRLPVQIKSPAGVVRLEREMRQVEEEMGCGTDEMTFFRFGFVIGMSGTFALKKYQDEEWRVVLWSDEGEIPAKEIMENDAYPSFGCFDEWVCRLLETDGGYLAEMAEYAYGPYLARRVS